MRAGQSEDDPDDEHFSWRSTADVLLAPFSREASDVVALAVQYDLCVTGDGLAHCARIGIDAVVIGCTQVPPCAISS